MAESVFIDDESPRTEAGRGYLMGKSAYCYVCGLAWYQSECVEYNGKFYGIPCGCHGDIKDLIRRDLGRI